MGPFDISKFLKQQSENPAVDAIAQAFSSPNSGDPMKYLADKVKEEEERVNWKAAQMVKELANLSASVRGQDASEYYAADENDMTARMDESGIPTPLNETGSFTKLNAPREKWTEALESQMEKDKSGGDLSSLKSEAKKIKDPKDRLESMLSITGAEYNIADKERTRKENSKLTLEEKIKQDEYDISSLNYLYEMVAKGRLGPEKASDRKKLLDQINEQVAALLVKDKAGPIKALLEETKEDEPKSDSKLLKALLGIPVLGPQIEIGAADFSNIKNLLSK